jgi:hypothetical protein
MNRTGKVGVYRVRLSSYTEYGELSEQCIRNEFLSYETLELFAAILTFGEDFTSILYDILHTLRRSQLIQNKLFSANIS